MGKTFKRNSEDFHRKKESYEGRNCNKKSNFYLDPDLIVESKFIIDSNNRKNKKYDVYNDKGRRK